MRLWAYKQDNTVPGCGEADCCGEPFQEIDWSFHLSVKPMTEEQFIKEHGGGPILEIRQATAEESIGYWAGFEDGTESGWANAELWFQKKQDLEFQEMLDNDRIKLIEQLKNQELSEMDTKGCQESILDGEENLHERTKNDNSEPSDAENVAQSARTSEFVKGKKLLDPATLTPESLYELQSRTWAQGAEYERDLWRSRLERIRTWNPTSSNDFHEGALHERMRIIDLIHSTYVDMELQETGSFVWSEDIVELIEKGNK